jgi:hypothetical protein
MAQAISAAVPPSAVKSETRTVPWYVWNFAIAVLSVTIGGFWDISWHASIGRDSFWTPAHMLIYLCGILGGLGSAVLILRTTFDSTSSLRPSSVRLWGFRGPLGAFVAAWGGVAMLVSAPFDDWWHNTYGLDVKVLSPPHVVLIFGVLAIKFGALLIILGEMNRASGELRKKLLVFFVFVGTLLARDIVGMFSLEFLQRTQMHSARFYLVAMMTVPLGHVAIARASGLRWGLTTVGAISMAITLAFLWILPLFPAEAKLGPVYREVTHFIPIGGFPLLLVIPFLLIDYITPRTAEWPEWPKSVLFGMMLLFGLLAVQWPFADFLQSPAARNWFFGSHYLPFFANPNGDSARFVFSQIETSEMQFLTRMALAALAAIISTRMGLSLGNWMLKIQR